MFKKISLAAALLCCAAISPAAYAQGIGAAIGDAASGIANAGEDIVDGAENVGRDILNGFTADDSTGVGPGSSGGNIVNNGGDKSDNIANYNGTTGSAVRNTTSDSANSTSDSLSSGSNSSTAAGGNPNTGISMGYVASAAVLAAMGVVVTAVKRRDD